MVMSIVVGRMVGTVEAVTSAHEHPWTSPFRLMNRDAKPPVIVIDVVLERQTAKEVLRALLHAILFHRLLGTVKPQTSVVLDVTLPAVKDPEIEELVDEKVNMFWRAVESGRHKRGQMILTLAEKRQKKWTVTQIFSPVEEEVDWEEWIINTELRQPHTDRDRQALNTALSTALTDSLRKILTHTSSERGRAAVPLITNPFNGLSPFPIHIRVKVGGVDVAN